MSNDQYISMGIMLQLKQVQAVERIATDLAWSKTKVVQMLVGEALLARGANVERTSSHAGDEKPTGVPIAIVPIARKMIG